MQEEIKESPLTADEMRMHDFLIEQQKGFLNIAPGSPLHDRLMGVNPVRRSEFLGTTPEPKQYSPAVMTLILVGTSAVLSLAFVTGAFWIWMVLK